MLRSIRKHLRRIQYYSAKTDQSRWATVIDTALFVTLALSVVASALSELLIVRLGIADLQHGRLLRIEDGLRAQLVDEEHLSSGWIGTPHGEFTLKIVQQQHGAPFVSRLVNRPVEADVNIFADHTIKAADVFAEGSSALRALEHAMQRSNRAELFHRWREGPREAVTVQRRWGMLLFNAVLWWIGLYVLAVIMIQLVRGMSALAQHHRASREAMRMNQGLCTSCGYDLRGLEFEARCPECGELVR